MIPYIIIKYSNGDEVMAEVIAETPLNILVRNPIMTKKVFISNDNGVKVQKMLSMDYAPLAETHQICIPKNNCNYVAVLKSEAREHYETLVQHYIINKEAPVETVVESVEDVPDKSKIH